MTNQTIKCKFSIERKLEIERLNPYRSNILANQTTQYDAIKRKKIPNHFKLKNQQEKDSMNALKGKILF